MGNVTVASMIRGDTIPVADTKPTFDPMYGFKDGRKKRVMIATEQEMEAAKVPMEWRNYCAHYFLNYLACQRIHYPFMYKCAAQKHQHYECEFEDYVLRMKEFERERRLRVRQKKKEEAQYA